MLWKTKINQNTNTDQGEKGSCLSSLNAGHGVWIRAGGKGPPTSEAPITIRLVFFIDASGANLVAKFLTEASGNTW